MKSEMKIQLLLDLIEELMMQTFVRTKSRVWLNSSIDMIQVQGFQYDPVYYQLLEPLSTGVQQRFSHTFRQYFILFWRHRGAPWSTVDSRVSPVSLTVTLQVDIPPSQQHSYDQSRSQHVWKMNERLQWKLLADIIIHLHLHYHHLNISSTPPHHNAGQIRGPIREQLGVRWGWINQWGLSVAVMMSNWCGILKCSFSQHLPRPESSSGIAELF